MAPQHKQIGFGLRIEQDRTDERRFRLEGDLDLANTPYLLGSVGRYAVEGWDISLDVEALRFLDSNGIKALMTIIQRLDGRGRLVLLNPPPHITDLITRVGLRDALAIVEGPAPPKA